MLGNQQKMRYYDRNKATIALYVKTYTQCTTRRVEIFFTASTLRRDIGADVYEIFERQLARDSARTQQF